GGARRRDARRRERRRRQRERDARTAPVRLLGVDDTEQAAAVGGHALDVVDAVEILVRRLLDHVPRRLLLAVVLRCDGADHIAGERMNRALELELLVTQAELHKASSPLTDQSIKVEITEAGAPRQALWCRRCAAPSSCPCLPSRGARSAAAVAARPTLR